MTVCACGRSDSHVFQSSNLPLGNICATTFNAFSCHTVISPRIFSHSRVASCTSRCISYPAPSAPALISENACKVPKTIGRSISRSVSFRRRLFGIPCRSRTAIRDNISAARGFCFLIRSKDSFQVLITEFWLSESLLRSPKSFSNRSCTLESLVRNMSRYSLSVM